MHISPGRTGGRGSVRVGEGRAKLNLAFSMVIFGTIGLFVRRIGLPSAVIAMLRGYIGFAVILLYRRLRGAGADRTALRENLGRLILSGAFIGVNWILLFEAYRYTSVAVATLCYYMQPVFVTGLSAVLLGERITLRRAVCVAVALAGMSLVSGVWEGAAGGGGAAGVLYGIGAAAFYAGVILINKKMTPMDPLQQTSVQLLSAAVTVTPYVLLTAPGAGMTVTAASAMLVLFVGVVHTGFAYVLYFGQLRRLSAQTAAIMSYIDPAVAILLSAAVLREPMTPAGAAGAALVLGATLFSELDFGKPSTGRE